MAITKQTVYRPNSHDHRIELALMLKAILQRAGFKLTKDSGRGIGEDVYYRTVRGTEGAIATHVFTSAVRGQVRTNGADAIRVCSVYCTIDGKKRGLGREKRINRTGRFGAIGMRLINRIARQDAFIANDVARCHCGAPKFLSSKGNYVCAEICWAK